MPLKTGYTKQKKSQRIRQYIYLTPEEKRKIKELANTKKLSASLLIVNLIQKELDKTPSLDLKV